MVPRSLKYIVVLFSLFISYGVYAGDSLYVKSIKSYVKSIEKDNGIFVVEKNKMFGLSDSSGELIIPIENKKFSGGGDCYYRFNKRYVFVLDSKVTVDIVCDSIDVGDGEAFIYKDGKSGITRWCYPGFVSPIIYDSIQVGFKETLLDAAYIDSKIDVYRLVDVPPKKLNKKPFEAIEVAQIKVYYYSPEYLYVKTNGKWGVMSDSGKMVIKTKYRDLDEAKRIFALWNK
ncbi:MAG: hypothetical protein HY840_04735 [Bacteroidetes bacterium]|nr:hypothetical protein [Bacteroidota bacterium]